MADLNSNVKEVVEDLRNKIENLSKLKITADEDTSAKINDIKQKAISVLAQASDKVVQAAQELDSIDEIEAGIEIVKAKSKELYKDAIGKINELNGAEIIEETKEEFKEFVNDTKKGINDFVESKQVQETISTVKETALDLSDKALHTLKDWLKPEDK